MVFLKSFIVFGLVFEIMGLWDNNPVYPLLVETTAPTHSPDFPAPKSSS